jgi:hypothetical protein
MQHDPKNIMLRILTIIGFTDDKNAAADEFLQNCEKQALLDLLTALPKEKQETFKEQITGVTDQAQQKTIILEYITPEQYNVALQKASQTAFEGLMKEVIPTLSNEQTTQLQSYLSSLTPPATHA